MGKYAIGVGVSVGVATAVALAALFKHRRSRSIQKKIKYSAENIPTFDLSAFLSSGEPNSAQCKEMADYLRDTGILVIKDPRVSADEAAAFTNLMQRYYGQQSTALMRDARPECAYQVGVTPENVECAKCAKDPKCLEKIDAMPAEDRPHKPTKADPKWRFFWRIGPRPAKSAFPEQNLEPVVPAAFPEWKGTMDAWGAKMLAALEATAELLAVGLGMDRQSLRELMREGPHLLAPTGSNLAQYDSVGTIFAGWHTDLNFLTIHGKSNYPGLYVWLRDGTKSESAGPRTPVWRTPLTDSSPPFESPLRQWR
jgi:isopenicillin N synthase-like dioxygenase